MVLLKNALAAREDKHHEGALTVVDVRWNMQSLLQAATPTDLQILLQLCEGARTNIEVAEACSDDSICRQMGIVLQAMQAGDPRLCTMLNVLAAAAGAPAVCGPLFKAVWRTALQHSQSSDADVSLAALCCVSALAQADAAQKVSADDVARLLGLLPSFDDGSAASDNMQRAIKTEVLRSLALASRFPNVAQSLAEEPGGLWALQSMLRQGADMRMWAVQALLNIALIPQLRSELNGEDQDIIECVGQIIVESSHSNDADLLMYKAGAAFAALSHDRDFSADFRKGNACMQAVQKLAKCGHAAFVGIIVCGVLTCQGQSRSLTSKTAAVAMGLVMDLGQVFEHAPLTSEPVAEAFLLLLEVLGQDQDHRRSLTQNGMMAALQALYRVRHHTSSGIGAGVWWGNVASTHTGRDRILRACKDVEASSSLMVPLLSEFCSPENGQLRFDAAAMIAGVIQTNPAQVDQVMASGGWAACQCLLSAKEGAAAEVELCAAIILAATAAGVHQLHERGIDVTISLFGQQPAPAIGAIIASYIWEIAANPAAAQRLLHLCVDSIEGVAGNGDLDEAGFEEMKNAAMLLLRYWSAAEKLPDTDFPYLVKLILICRLEDAATVLQIQAKTPARASRLIREVGVRWVVHAIELRPELVEFLLELRDEHLFLILSERCVRDLVEICESEACHGDDGAAAAAMGVLMRMAEDQEMVQLLHAQADEAGLWLISRFPVAGTQELLIALESPQHLGVHEPRMSRVHRGQNMFVDNADGAQSIVRQSVPAESFTSVRSTHGVGSGTLVFEVQILKLPAGAHCRIGWVTDQASLECGIGVDRKGVGYQDFGGRVFHANVGWCYGASYTEGDKVICMLTKGTDIVSIHWYLNGADQGDAALVGEQQAFMTFVDPAEVYFPAVSMYGPAVVSVKFGESNAFDFRTDSSAAGGTHTWNDGLCSDEMSLPPDASAEAAIEAAVPSDISEGVVDAVVPISEETPVQLVTDAPQEEHAGDDSAHGDQWACDMILDDAVDVEVQDMAYDMMIAVMDALLEQESIEVSNGTLHDAPPSGSGDIALSLPKDVMAFAAAQLSSHTFVIYERHAFCAADSATKGSGPRAPSRE